MFTGLEGVGFSGPVATFTDPDTTLAAGAFSASIDWGDGTSPTTGTVSGSAGSFSVTGGHTYAEERSTPYAVTVTITQTASPSNHGTASSSATVADAPLSAGAFTVPSQSFLNVVTSVSFTFTDGNPAAPASDFTATIDWGDGSTSTATVSRSGGSFVAQASHVYVALGHYDVMVTVNDKGGSKTTAMESTTVVGGRATVDALLGPIDAAIAGATSRHDGDVLKDVRKKLVEALDPKLWLDGTHVVAKGGEKVFDRAKDVVHKLQDLQKDKKSQIPDATLQGWIDALVAVAQTLAVTEIADATSAGGNAHKLADAASELTKAANELAKGHFEQAIEHYKQAWKHAEDSLDRHGAPPSQAFEGSGTTVTKTAAPVLYPGISGSSNLTTPVVLSDDSQGRETA